jgi:lipoprotein-anchoring transpeptidase ErfK/SrfK
LRFNGQNGIEDNWHHGWGAALSTRLCSIGAFVFLGAAVIAGSPADAGETVRLNGYPAGTVVIKTSERRLYYVTGEGQAIRYPVGVGKGGMAWAGTTSIDGKHQQSEIGRRIRLARMLSHVQPRHYGPV